MLNRPFSCKTKYPFKTLIHTVCLTALLQPTSFTWADSASLPTHSTTASSVQEVIQDRPILTNWVAEYRPTDFEEWPQDKQIAYIDNQEQARALIRKIRYQQCSNIPCLAALDCAQKIYEKSQAQKRFQERSLYYLYANTLSTDVTSLALGIIFTSISYAIGNVPLAISAAAMVTAHSTISQLFTYDALSVMNNDLQKTETLLAIEKEAIVPIATKLETASQWAAQARKAILHNISLEHSGNITLHPTEELSELLADNTIQNLEMPVQVRRSHFSESFLEKLSELPDGKVFALSLIKNTHLTFKGILYNNQFYIVIPHPTENIVFGFTQASHLLAFFSDVANHYKAENISLMTPAS